MKRQHQTNCAWVSFLTCSNCITHSTAEIGNYSSLNCRLLQVRVEQGLSWKLPGPKIRCASRLTKFYNSHALHAKVVIWKLSIGFSQSTISTPCCTMYIDLQDGTLWITFLSPLSNVPNWFLSSLVGSSPTTTMRQTQFNVALGWNGGCCWNIRVAILKATCYTYFFDKISHIHLGSIL